VSDARQLVLDRPSRCSICGTSLGVGDLVSVNESDERITCLECLGEPIPVYDFDTSPGAGFRIGTPGGSAEREYERRRSRERQTAKQQRGLRIGLVALAAVGGYMSVQVIALVFNHALRTQSAVSTHILPPSTAHGLGFLLRQLQALA
jgi:hypothetical protein